MSLQRQEPWDSAPEHGPCVCSQLRRAARKVSSLYDRSLSEAGLSVTQHAMLVNIARAGEISRTALAAKLGMDRTTLTRNLIPLEKAGLVSPAESKDRRARSLSLSLAGRRKLRQSYALWREAQASFARQLGKANLAALRGALDNAEASAES
jgi:DNA-binding MarR family transcriptional regulator